MTKLMEWLICTSTFLTIWLSVITNRLDLPIAEEYNIFILYFPLIALLLFGVYAATVVMYRVFTFNNCEEAAKELQQQIEVAKADLSSKGFKF